MNDKKGKSVKKYCGRNATLKIKLLSLFVVAIISIFSLNEVFAMDSIKKELYTKYSFKRMPNFVVPRSFGATATVLQDGNVLFTGGFVSRLNSTNSTEVYSPIKNKFLKLPNMNDSRAFHSAILLSNGDVLITGGRRFERGKGSFSLKSAEIYKTKENKFVKISNMNEEMYNHKMYLLPNNNVVVIKNPNKIELFDVKTNTFKKIEGISYDNILTSYEFIELCKDKILMYPYNYIYRKKPIVLLDLRDLSLKEININPFLQMKYNPILSNNTIEQLKNGRENYNIAKISDSEILVTGGKGGDLNGCRSARIININTLIEKTTPDMPRPGKFFHSSISILNNNVLILGGQAGSDFSLQTLNSSLIYIYAQNEFLKFKNMIYKRSSPSFVMLNNGNYIIWGGSNVMGNPYPPEMLVVNNK